MTKRVVKESKVKKKINSDESTNGGADDLEQEWKQWIWRVNIHVIHILEYHHCID